MWGYEYSYVAVQNMWGYKISLMCRWLHVGDRLCNHINKMGLHNPQSFSNLHIIELFCATLTSDGKCSDGASVVPWKGGEVLACMGHYIPRSSYTIDNRAWYEALISLF